ncbi:MAG: carboxypeptidase regulatory-like domain-containing protein [Gemmatimonadota bacterium]|nr:carboxypeptidase regulatory-like domain-containing protein [Gemmatimonadota bacterium]
MSESRLTFACAAALLAALLSGAQLSLPAQGVTTGAVTGLVTDEGGQPVENAQIQVINRSTGYSTGAVTRNDGRYFIQGLEVGGPYTVNVRILGFIPQTRDDLRIALSQAQSVDFQLVRQATQLAAVTVEGDANAIFSSSRQGVQTVVTDSALRRLPTLNRNFTDFVVTAPQVSTTGPGLSGGGVNNRYNNIQIDGASENDVFGLGSTGQPGGQAGGKSIPLEAVKEYQVLLSPFDVRQGGFTGLLVNAVTQNGTNNFRGTAFYTRRDQSLAREQDFIREFDHAQYGFSLGGPIIRDRLHFFVAPEIQRRESPAAGPFLGSVDPTTQPDATDADIARFTSLLEGYGIEPGSAGSFTIENPLINAFGRMDLALPEWNSRLVLRHNFGQAEDDNFSRSTSTFSLASNGYFFESEKNATVGQFFTNFANGASNELIVGFNRIRDSRTPFSRSPQISVRAPRKSGTGTITLRAGSEQFSHANELDQDVFEIQNNVTFPIGTHRITVGTKNEFYKIRNLFAESAFGVYSFASLDSLEAGNPGSYRLSVDLGNGIEANFRAAQYGVYAQDVWQASENLSLTFGLRLDVPVLRDKPRFTPVVDSIYGRQTDQVPSGNLHFSPRLGFNLDLSGETRRQLRGGLGVFVGRPAFVWIGNAFQNSGSNLGFLNCGGSRDPGRAPAFSPSSDNQPQACIHRTTGQPVGVAQGVVGPVNLLSEDLMFPQTLRGSLGFDQELPGGVIATVEGLYTRGLNNFFYINRNLVGPRGTDRNGRVVYGDTIRTTGAPVPSLVSSRFSEVIDVENQSEDYSFNITGQLQKQFTGGFDLRAAYTFSRARDVQSLTSSRAISNWRFGRTLAGDHLSQDAGISSFDQPHKVTLAGTYTFPWRTWATDLSVIYLGQSGEPFNYIYGRGAASGSGDLNADGVQGNDLIYVPSDASDPTEILFAGDPGEILAQQAAFESFINNSDCLREQRGSILERNSCRTPWQNIVNLSLRQSLPSFRGNTLTAQLDVFNFLNLLDKEWGLREFAPGGFAQVEALSHEGQTPGGLTSSQGLFGFDLDEDQFQSDNLSSNYQLQLSLRYSFF